MNGARPDGMLPHLSERFVKLATVATKIVKKSVLCQLCTIVPGSYLQNFCVMFGFLFAKLWS